MEEIWKYLHKPRYVDPGQLNGAGETAAQVATVNGKNDVAALLQQLNLEVAESFDVQITQVPIGMGIHEEGSLVVVTGEVNGAEVIAGDVQPGDFLISVSTQVYTRRGSVIW